MEKITVNLIHGFKCGLNSGDKDHHFEVYSNRAGDLPKKCFDIVFGDMKSKWYMTKHQFLSWYRFYVNKINWIEYNGETLPIESSSTYDKDLTRWLSNEVQKLVIEDGTPIIDSIIDLLPGMKVYTSSGKLGYEGKVLFNNGKHVIADFNGVTVTLNKKGNYVGTGEFANKKFSVYDYRDRSLF